MSCSRRRRKSALRSRWVHALAARADERLRPLANVIQYGCRHCGLVMGIAGEATTEDDYDQDRYFDEQVASHEAGECKAVA